MPDHVRLPDVLRVLEAQAALDHPVISVRLTIGDTVHQFPVWVMRLNPPEGRQRVAQVVWRWGWDDREHTLPIGTFFSHIAGAYPGLWDAGFGSEQRHQRADS